jgi:hypothetical protein
MGTDAYTSEKEDVLGVNHTQLSFSYLVSHTQIISNQASENSLKKKQDVPKIRPRGLQLSHAIR